jgi:aryl-alcohol dehydrogenase-like predicted oxidoreductase
VLSKVVVSLVICGSSGANTKVKFMQRTLGKSGIQVSALGMGCWAIGGPFTWAQPGQASWPAGWGKTDDEESIRALHAGLDAGISFFDTAANYGAGHSEVVIGRALKGKRDLAVVATKFGHIVNEARKEVFADDSQIPENIRSDVENSLRRLNTDYIDLYQFHQGSYSVDRAPELISTLEELVTEGKIRWFGWSTDLPDRAAVFADSPHCTAIQFSLNALQDNPKMRALCQEKNLAGINKDPLSKGVLTGKFNALSTFPADDVRSRMDFSKGRAAMSLKKVEAMREIFTEGSRTMAQGALAFIWAMDERMIPIPGFKSVQQVLDNAGAMEFGPLTISQLDQIQSLMVENS